MNKAFILVAAFSILASEPLAAEDWKISTSSLPTRWTAVVSPSNALPEYPRPQLVRRGDWMNLNGLWNYAISSLDAAKPNRYEGSILVPYPLESALSGVHKTLGPDQVLWYKRTFTLKSKPTGRRMLLHFGAVDYRTSVYVNDREIGTHVGGYQAFVFDITDSVVAGGNLLVVKVLDPTDSGANPHGKQTLRPQGIGYTPSSGIWQTVWLENVPDVYISRLNTTPDVDRSDLILDVEISGTGPNFDSSSYSIQATASEGSIAVAKQNLKGATRISIKHPRLWSPDDPFLYDLTVRLLRSGQIVDEVKSYFGMRKIEVRKDSRGIERIFLNDRYTYNLGILDQGFWPDGIYTAPTDAALKFDIQAAKAMGFNTIRKHIKVEPDRWYYYCDRIGMLVWQDMVPPGNDSNHAHAEFEREAESTLEQLRNHPSIVTWVLFNEGWQAYEQGRVAAWIKSLDSSRLVDAQSGANVPHLAEWERHLNPSVLSKVLRGDNDPFFTEFRTGGFKDPTDWVGSDLMDIHVYPGPQVPPSGGTKARVLGEHGGFGAFIEGHSWNDIAGFGSVTVAPGEMSRTYAELVDKLKKVEADGLSGSIYTQSFDVEQEQNGLITYDREISKIPVKEIAKINASLVPTAANYDWAAKGFSVKDADLTPRDQRYGQLLKAYHKVHNSLEFLRRFIVMAAEQKDQEHATLAFDEFLDRLPRPYSKDDWTFIIAMTRSSKDGSFELLRSQSKLIDSVVGDNAAEKAVRNIIGREEVEPLLSAIHSPAEWSTLERATSAKYGGLGLEEVYGAEMLYYLEQEDWEKFATYYVLYYNSAVGRSKYSINDLSYVLFKHVTDAAALEVGLKACRLSLDSGGGGLESDPTAMDTYANLLYKTGKYGEAIKWEEKAVKITEGHNLNIVEHLEKMEAGEPTWPAG